MKIAHSINEWMKIKIETPALKMILMILNTKFDIVSLFNQDVGHWKPKKDYNMYKVNEFLIYYLKVLIKKKRNFQCSRIDTSSNWKNWAIISLTCELIH